MGYSRKGFTLIELMIVVIIVGILAAIAGPMFTGNIAKARRSEAVATAGALRTAARLYGVENAANTAYTRADLLPYLTATDINGKYYNNSDFSANSTWIKASTGLSGWVNMNTTTGDLFQG